MPWSTSESGRAPREAAGRPKVAVFSSRFLAYSQTFVYEQIRHHQRYLVEVFTREHLHSEQFPFYPIHSLTPGRGWRGGLEAWVYRVTLLSPTFFRLFRHGQFRLVHAHFGSAACYALPYCARFKLPLVVTFHGYDVPLLLSSERFYPANWGYWACSRWLFDRADLLLTVSEDLRSLLISAGAPAAKVAVHRLGINTELAPRVERTNESDIVVLMAGRMVEKKGFEYAIRALAQVLKKHPALRLRLVGDGERRHDYERLIRSLGLSAEQMEILGVLSHDELLETMRHSDIVLVPSVTARNGDREGIPMIVYEAAALGMPTIASSHGGIPEVIEDGVTGLLVPERDEVAIARALLHLIDNRALRRSLGEAARRKAQSEFDIRQRTVALEARYDELLSPTGRRRRRSSTTVL